jgi:putative chitinase
MTFDKTAFYDHVRAKLGRLSTMQVEGFEAVLKAIEGAPLSHQAYMLATAWHETDKTMQPVREAFRLSENWRKKNLRYWPHYGRGYVQTTWERNYRKLDEASAAAGLTKAGEILANPDLAMRPDIAALALRKGMEDGWYDSNGKKMSQRLPMKGVATREQYVNARKLVNILDKAELIEDYAQIFERALRNGGLT